MRPICPYCAAESQLVTGALLYPHRNDLWSLHFWHCAPCDAYVGCHKKGLGHGDGTRPLGRLANAELRRAKNQAHAAFDPLWKNRKIRRRDAYDWLAKQLGLPVDRTHIGDFDVETCLRVVEICRQAVL